MHDKRAYVLPEQAVPALLADSQWEALGKRLRGIEAGVQVWLPLLHMEMRALHAPSQIGMLPEARCSWQQAIVEALLARLYHAFVLFPISKIQSSNGDAVPWAGGPDQRWQWRWRAGRA